MSNFFIGRPIVAIVISIMTLGLVYLAGRSGGLHGVLVALTVGAALWIVNVFDAVAGS